LGFDVSYDDARFFTWHVSVSSVATTYRGVLPDIIAGHVRRDYESFRS
jgi:hypothetical protein